MNYTVFTSKSLALGNEKINYYTFIIYVWDVE